MKQLFLSCLALAMIPMVALAGGRELATHKIQELTTLPVGSIVSGDIVPVYDASTFTVKGVDALLLKPYVRAAMDAVASGGASKAVTIAGVTAASKCVASIAEATTNAVYVRGVVPTADTVTVTLSGDPGASNADIDVVCVD